MTKWIVIDTEGSGLFDYKLPADAPGQPRLAALGMLYLTPALELEREYSVLIRPDGWELGAEAATVNGLTMARLEAEGVPVALALEEYSQAIRDGYAVAAFNAQHDCKTIRAELRRAGMDDLFLLTKNFCCMRKANGVIPKADGRKGWPKLSEAVAFLGIDNTGPHTAAGDAHAAWAILRHLRDHGVDLSPEVHFAKEKPEGTPDSTPARVLKRGKAKADALAEAPLAEQEIPL